MGTRENACLPDCQRERGAALITVLLTSTLLLSAGLALMVSTSIGNTTSIDSTAEMQAYFGAEAGIQGTLNVLRGNVAPHATLSGTKINFRTAAHPATSNKTTDSLASGTGAVARLSGWLNYSYENAAVANDWRVPVTASYAPFTGIAYKVVITDPDDPGPIATRKITTDPSYYPTRLMIQSEGYGPKGAIKRLEMVVKYSAFELTTPGTITLAGGTGANIELGESAVVTYTGNDFANPPQSQIPALAVSSSNLPTAQTAINTLNGSSGSTPPGTCPGGAQISPCAAGTLTDDNTPGFLQSADTARAFLDEMRALASSQGRLFGTHAQANTAGGLGTSSNPQFTFIDNYGTESSPGPTVTLGPGHQGSGLLIVTGNLDTNGATDFEGIILVLGRGRVTRSGGGHGTIKGTIIVANFDPYGEFGDPFGNPSFSMAGGGISAVRYDSAWIRRAMGTSGLVIMGIREYH